MCNLNDIRNLGGGIYAVADQNGKLIYQIVINKTMKELLPIMNCICKIKESPDGSLCFEGEKALSYCSISMQSVTNVGTEKKNAMVSYAISWLLSSIKNRKCCIG